MAKKSFGKGKLGSGARFSKCESSGKSAALCAFIGRRAHGKKAMARYSKMGKNN